MASAYYRWLSEDMRGIPVTVIPKTHTCAVSSSVAQAAHSEARSTHLTWRLHSPDFAPRTHSQSHFHLPLRSSLAFVSHAANANASRRASPRATTTHGRVLRPPNPNPNPNPNSIQHLTWPKSSSRFRGRALGKSPRRHCRHLRHSLRTHRYPRLRHETEHDDGEASWIS